MCLTFNMLWNIIKDPSLISGLIGVLVGSWLTNRQIHVQRKLDFYEKQLRELYSPLIGIRNEIRTLGEFRVSRLEASRKWSDYTCEQGKQISDPIQQQKFFEKRSEKIKGPIEYENQQMEKVLLPAYRRMKDVFKENLWLANPDIINYLSTLTKFIETWDRFLSESHPMEVLEEIKVDEEELNAFYKSIETTHHSLVEKLKGKI